MNEEINIKVLREELIDFLVKYLKNELYIAEAIVDSYLANDRKSIKEMK